MLGDSNFVEETMELADNSVDLLRKVTGIHLSSAAARAAQRQDAIMDSLCSEFRNVCMHWRCALWTLGSESIDSGGVYHGKE